MSIPSFGIGTYRLTGQTARDSVKNALQLGYRAIDTAQIYDNEAEVGRAVAESKIPREELFITTKIWVDHCTQDQLCPSLKESLSKLQSDYVDLTLIHWPAPSRGISINEMMQALLETKQQGFTRNIGISNFNIALTQEAMNAIGHKEIATNQIELHPYLQNRKLAEFCSEAGIHITSYMTLAYGKILNDAVIHRIARNHKATTAQIALAWALQLGYAVIPSSTRIEHLQSNLEAQKIVLTDSEMEQIATLDCKVRLANPSELAPLWD